MNRREALTVLTAMPAVARISRADVTPASVIVVETDKRLSVDMRTQIRDSLQRIWPHNQIVICDEGLRIKIADGPA
jgi:hypothetical protein